MRVSWFSIYRYLACYATEKALLNFGGKFKSTYLKVRTIIQSTFSISHEYLQKITNHKQNNDRRDKAEIRNSSRMCLWILLVLLMHMWAAACMYGVINSQIVSNKTCMGSIIYFIEGRSSSRLVYVNLGVWGMGNPRLAFLLGKFWVSLCNKTMFKDIFH